MTNVACAFVYLLVFMFKMAGYILSKVRIVWIQCIYMVCIYCMYPVYILVVKSVLTAPQNFILIKFFIFKRKDK